MIENTQGISIQNHHQAEASEETPSPLNGIDATVAQLERLNITSQPLNEPTSLKYLQNVLTPTNQVPQEELTYWMDFGCLSTDEEIPEDRDILAILRADIGMSISKWNQNQNMESGFFSLPMLGHEDALIGLQQLTKIFNQFEGSINEGLKSREEQSGNTFMHIAAQTGDVEAIKILHITDIFHSQFNNLNQTPLHIAAQNGQPNALQALIDLNCYTPDYYDDRGRTALHYAAASGDIESIHILLDLRLDPNIPDNEGNTALHLAVRGKNTEVIHLLGSTSADPNLPNNEGFTPLHLATMLHSVDSIRALKHIRANASCALANSGLRPLHLAAPP